MRDAESTIKTENNGLHKLNTNAPYYIERTEGQFLRGVLFSAVGVIVITSLLINNLLWSFDAGEEYLGFVFLGVALLLFGWTLPFGITLIVKASRERKTIKHLSKNGTITENGEITYVKVKGKNYARNKLMQPNPKSYGKWAIGKSKEQLMRERANPSYDVYLVWLKYSFFDSRGKECFGGLYTVYDSKPNFKKGQSIAVIFDETNPESNAIISQYTKEGDQFEVGYLPKTEVRKLKSTLLKADKNKKFSRKNLGILTLGGIVTGIFVTGFAVFLWILVYNIYDQLDGYSMLSSMIVVVPVALFLSFLALGGFVVAFYADITYIKMKRLVYSGKLTRGIWVKSERFSQSKHYEFVFMDDKVGIVQKKMLMFLYGNYSSDNHKKHLSDNQKYKDCYVAYDDKNAFMVYAPPIERGQTFNLFEIRKNQKSLFALQEQDFHLYIKKYPKILLTENKQFTGTEYADKGIDREILCDLDSVNMLCDDVAASINYGMFLDFWDATLILAKTIKESYVGTYKKYNGLYNQLFEAAAQRDVDPEYDPMLTAKDLEDLKLICKNGLQLWDNVIEH